MFGLPFFARLLRQYGRLFFAVSVLAVCLALSASQMTNLQAAEGLRVATFQVDVTPPLGSPLCDGLVPPAEAVDDPLSARGIILDVPEGPIVLVAVDWVGIGNTGHDEWRSKIAAAAKTTMDRVTVHTLHQHDAPGHDELSEAILSEHGLAGRQFDAVFARATIGKVAKAVADASAALQPCTHVGVGFGIVEGVASNRRILNAEGKVEFVRLSSCRDEKVRAMPEGLIDPKVRLVGFWNGDKPLAVLTYYATHPQSYYGKGRVSADFVGMARDLSQKVHPGVPHIHFDGAGGNLAAGKYNDGSPENRPVLAGKLAKGMELAWQDAAQKKHAVQASDVKWKACGVVLPPRGDLNEESLKKAIADGAQPLNNRIRSARELAFLRRCAMGHETQISCLTLGNDRVVHLPGEIFVEYQIAAQGMHSAGEVCVAGYGDYGAGYIGTEISYGQGGYETGVVSRVAPSVEKKILATIAAALEKPAK